MSNERMQAAIKELQDIEKRQSEVLKDLNGFRIRSEKNQDRIETNLAEITDKLNGLIGYMDGQRPQ
jgi:hypothetical protein